MYRSVAFYCIKNHIDLNDEQAVEQAISNIQIRLTADNKVYLNDEDVSLQIRTDEVSLGASCVSKYQAVRTFLVDEQRKMAETGNVILDGRDIGTVVLPHADAALMMQLGAEGVFVGSGIFKSGNPAKRAASIVKAVTNYTDAKLIAELSTDLGEAMVGINEQEIELLMAERGK